MALWNKIVFSGSNASLNQVTASFFKGDGSALTGVISSSYAISASWAPTGQNVTASYALTASYAGIYRGSGTIPPNTIAFIPSASIFKFRYSTLNDAIILSDLDGTSTLGSGDGLAYLSAMNGGAASIVGLTTLDLLNSNFELNFGTNAVFTDFSGNGGIKYAAEYSSSYTSMSLASVGYVNEKIKLVPSSSYALGGSGSFIGNGSGLTGVVASASPSGPDQSIQFRDGSSISGSSDLLFDKTNRLLKLSGATTINSITASGTVDNYLQINIQNLSSGTTGSSDIVATNNLGTELGNYIDMGINNSGFNQPSYLGNANDGYLYTTGSRLIIGNTTPSTHPSSSILFVVGGTNASQNTKMTISSSGQVSASSFVGDGSGLTGIVKTIGITIDGGGSVITTGIKGDVVIPFNANIISWYLTADQVGSIVIDVWKSRFSSFPPTVTNTIAGTNKPTLSGVNKNSNTSFTTFTGSLFSEDVIRFNVDSVATVTRVNLILKAVTT